MSKNRKVEKVELDNTPGFTEFSNIMFGLLQDYSEKKETKGGTVILSSKNQSVNEIPIEELLNSINKQGGQKIIELTPELGELYRQLIGRAFDIAKARGANNDEKTKKFIRSCEAQFPNLREGFNN